MYQIFKHFERYTSDTLNLTTHQHNTPSDTYPYILHLTPSPAPGCTCFELVPVEPLLLLGVQVLVTLLITATIALNHTLVALLILARLIVVVVLLRGLEDLVAVL